MATRDIERGWLNLSEAAQYAGVDRKVLREAVNSGDLVARVRPRTRAQERRSGATCDQTRAMFSRNAIDAWMDSQPEATFGVAQ